MKKLSDELKYFLSGSVFLGASSMYSLIVPVIIIPYLIKTVGLSNYGLSVIAFSVTFFLSLFIDFGYNISGVNQLSKSKLDSEKGEIIIRAVFTKIILFITISGVFIICFLFIPYLRDNYLLFLYSLCIPFASIFNLNWALQGLQKIKLLSIINIINRTIYAAGLFLFVSGEEDHILINFMFGLGIFISGLLSIFFIHKEIPLAYIPFKKSTFIKEVRSSGHYFISNISIYLSANIYPLILSFFVSSEIVGIFSAVEKIYNLLRSVFSIYINLMLPRVSFWIETSIKKAIDSIVKTYIYVIIFVVSEIIFVWIFRREVIMFFLEDYVQLSIDLLQISLIGLVIVLFNCPLYLMLLAMDKRREIMKTFLMGPLIGILLCFLLSKYYGISGTLYTIIIIELFYVVVLNKLLYARKGLFRKGT